MKKTGYIFIAAGFLLSLRAAGGCETESMSMTEIIITAIIGIALMIVGDILKNKKRTTPLQPKKSVVLKTQTHKAKAL